MWSAATTWSGNERSELTSWWPRSPRRWPARGLGVPHGCTRLFGQALELSPAREVPLPPVTEECARGPTAHVSEPQVPTCQAGVRTTASQAVLRSKRDVSPPSFPGHRADHSHAFLRILQTRLALPLPPLLMRKALAAQWTAHPKSMAQAARPTHSHARSPACAPRSPVLLHRQVPAVKRPCFQQSQCKGFWTSVDPGKARSHAAFTMPLAQP